MADRYWVGGTASWDATAGTKWSTTSGGAGGAAVPTSSDAVFFDANSGVGTVTISGSRVAASIDCTGFGGTIAGTGAWTISGSLTLVAGMTYSRTGATTFTAAVAKTLTSAGKTLAAVTVNAGSLQLLDALAASTISVTTAADFDANDFALTLTGFLHTLSTTGTVDFGNGNWTFSGSSGVYLAVDAATTIVPGTGALIFSGSGTHCGFDFSGNTISRAAQITGTYDLVQIATSVGLTSLSITNDLTPLFLVAGVTLALGSMAIDGTSSTARRLIYAGTTTGFQGPDPVNSSTISVPSGTVTLDSIASMSIDYAGGATFEANNSANIVNNTGMTFNSAGGLTTPLFGGGVVS